MRFVSFCISAAVFRKRSLSGCTGEDLADRAFPPDLAVGDEDDQPVVEAVQCDHVLPDLGETPASSGWSFVSLVICCEVREDTVASRRSTGRGSSGHAVMM